MPNPKLFLFKARAAPVVAILRRDAYKHNWELIRWNLETDVFTCGQWLTKAVMNGKYCAISPNGKYFAYSYSSIRKDAHWKSYAVVSELPYFSASLIRHGSTIGFRNDGFLKKRACDDLEDWKDEASGYVDTFVDGRGRVITTEMGVVKANGEVIYDTTDHVFQAMECPIPLCVETDVKPVEETKEGFYFQDGCHFAFTLLTEGTERNLVRLDNHIDLVRNLKGTLLQFGKSLGAPVNNAMTKEQLVKVILECEKLHPLLRQYNDGAFVDGSAMHAYDGNKEDARKATLARIRRDMLGKIPIKRTESDYELQEKSHRPMSLPISAITHMSPEERKEYLASLNRILTQEEREFLSKLD